MDELNLHIEELIGKVLTGEASAAERAELEQWKAAHPEGRTYFNELKKLYEGAAVAPAGTYDVDKAWQSVAQRLASNETVHPAAFSRNRNRWLAIAATLAMLLAVGAYVFLVMEDEDAMNLAAADNVLQAQLPDGSAVVLNKFSQLNYHFESRLHERRLQLRGEARFEVKSKRDTGFVVEAGELLIRDVGTIFTVRAMDGADTVSVYVSEGKVKLYTEGKSGINLSAGESGIYVASLSKFQKNKNPDVNAAAFADRTFRFSNEPLARVVQKLNAVYDIKLVLQSPALRECRLTATFVNEDPASIARVIAETFGLEMQVSEGTIVLSGSGC